MGKRGPLPKEDGRRQRARASKNLRLVEAYDPETMPTPEPPDTLGPAQLEAWDRFFASPLAGLVKDTDMAVVRRLFTYYQQHDDLGAIFERSKLVSGSTGQPRMNPAHDAMLKLEGAILRLENELGLTPSARLRLGITFADATTSLTELTDRLQDRATEDEDALWAEL